MRTTVSPAVEGVDVVVRVQVQGVDVLSGEALGMALLVETQTDEIAVHPEDALELSALIPMQRDGVAEPFALQELLALEDHRQTRRGQYQGRSQGGALLGVVAGRIVVVDLLGDAGRTVGDLVVGLGVDDAGEGVTVGELDGIAHGVHVTSLVGGGDDSSADRVDEMVVPLGVEGGTVVSGGDDLGLTVQVLGDGDGAWELLADLGVDPVGEAPAVGDVHLTGIDTAHVRGHVVAQAVGVKLFQPHHGVVANELADLAAAVVGTGVAPRGRGLPVVVEVDAALVVLAPSVELPQVEVRGAEVVVDDVDDDRQAVLVAGFDEVAQLFRAAVGALDGEDVGRVVTPRVVPGELHERHELDGVDAQVDEVVDLRLDVGQVGGLVVVRILVEEGSDVHLVDDELVQGRGSEVVTLPVVGAGIGDDAIADRARHVAGVRVDAGDHLVTVDEDETVLVAHRGTGGLAVPVAVVLADELELGRANLLGVVIVSPGLGCPVVEGSGDGDCLGVRGPHAERGATVDERDTHALGTAGVVGGNWIVGIRAGFAGRFLRIVGHRSPCRRNNHGQRYPSVV